MGCIEVIKGDGILKRQVWRFWYNDSRNEIVLSRYTVEEKKTNRHKFRVVKVYNRLDKRDNTIAVGDVPLPDDVKEAAMKQFLDSLNVTK